MSSFDEFLGGTIEFSKISAVYFKREMMSIHNNMGNEAPDFELLDCQP
jgi:hypothetical protein